MRSDARANRERILDAAAEVFGAGGAEASTEEVARRAGVGIATVFRHFPTKDDLVAAAVEQHVALILDRARVLAEQDDALGALGSLVEAMVQPGAARVAVAGRPGDPVDLVQTAARPLRLALGRALRRAQASGQARADVTVDQLYLLVRGLAAATAGPSPRRAALRGAVAVVVAGLRAT